AVGGWDGGGLRAGRRQVRVPVARGVPEAAGRSRVVDVTGAGRGREARPGDGQRDRTEEKSELHTPGIHTTGCPSLAPVSCAPDDPRASATVAINRTANSSSRSRRPPRRPCG